MDGGERLRTRGGTAAAAGAASARAVNLALQGGGAHGAFTWGVLDRLLEDERLTIEGISGTSAGAINGAMLVAGMIEGGRDGARARLREFWRRVADCSQWSPLQPTPWDRLFGNFNLDHSPAFQAFDLMTRLWSPNELNPLDVNPLRDIVSELVDFDRLRGAAPVKLFVNTTNVRTGKIRVFANAELRVEALLASACLPNLQKAVEIDGEHYWDGGFMGNPAMFPLLYNCKASDIVLVEINPIAIAGVPESARAIIDRMNSISFNATMMREMRTIAFVTRLLDQHRLTGRSHLRRINFHMIEAEDEMARYGVSSKLSPDWTFLLTLFELGRARTEAWLDRHFAKIGVDSSIDLQKLFF
jgi:NTE family protein